jgi:hypothetical protein
MTSKKEKGSTDVDDPFGIEYIEVYTRDKPNERAEGVEHIQEIDKTTTRTTYEPASFIDGQYFTQNKNINEEAEQSSVARNDENTSYIEQTFFKPWDRIQPKQERPKIEPRTKIEKSKAQKKVLPKEVTEKAAEEKPILKQTRKERIEAKVKRRESKMNTQTNLHNHDQPQTSDAQMKGKSNVGMFLFKSYFHFYFTGVKQQSTVRTANDYMDLIDLTDQLDDVVKVEDELNEETTQTFVQHGERQLSFTDELNPFVRFVSFSLIFIPLCIYSRTNVRKVEVPEFSIERNSATTSTKALTGKEYLQEKKYLQEKTKESTKQNVTKFQGLF